MAQGGYSQDQIGRLEHELERTRDLLIRAGEAIELTDVPTAVLALERARALLQEAVDAFRNRNFTLSMRYMMQARERAKLALGLARQAEQFEGAVQRRLERSEELLKRLREDIGASDKRQLQSLYRATRDNLDRGWEFYRRQQYKPALKLAQQVESATRRLTVMAGLDGDARANYERRRSHVQDFVDNTAELLVGCDAPPAERFMAQARQTLELAEQLIDANQPGRALEALKQSREAAVKAARECQGEERLERQYQNLLQRAEQLQSEHGSNDSIRPLLEQAREQLRLAREHLGNDRPEAAAAALQGASLALRRANDLVSRTP
jgi:hypothetical protein